MGWRYDWLLALDADVYDVLIAELSRIQHGDTGEISS
jgi:hypothetical protein